MKLANANGMSLKTIKGSINRKINKINKGNSMKNNRNKHVEQMMKNAEKELKEKKNLNATLTVKTPAKFNFKNKINKKKKTLYVPIKTPEKVENQDPEDSTNESSSENDHSPKGKSIKYKKMILNSPSETYKPGMLSDSIQIKKYGRVIIPWDPSFGLDETYKIPVIEEEGLPKLKINPLFDLSKRKQLPSSPFGEKSQRTVFVGNLPGNIHVKDIKKLFKKCGKTHSIKIKTRMGKSSKEGALECTHATALITFKEEESCEKALKLNGKLYQDRHLRVNKLQMKPDIKKGVFVGNIAFKMEDDALWKAFEGCGEIDGVRIVRDDRTGIGKGFGFVNFKTEESVEKALKLDGLSILERAIRVKRNESGAVSRPKSDMIRRKRKRKRNGPPPSDNKDNTGESKPKKKKVEGNEAKTMEVENKGPKLMTVKNNKFKRNKHKQNKNKQMTVKEETVDKTTNKVNRFQTKSKKISRPLKK